MELDQLRHFLAAAETKNFTRAAKRIGLSQPALSRSIGRLEQELGQPVFERQSRNVALTDAGRLLQSRAQIILKMVEDTKAEICDDGQTGRIRLAAIPTIAPYFLPGLLQQFSDQFPGAQLVVQEDTTDNLLKRCSQGEIDIAVIALPIETKYLEVEPLFIEELLLVVSPDSPLVEQDAIALEDLEDLPFVLLGEAHCLSDQIQSFCQQQSFHPVSVERTSQLATVQELVSLGHGISLVPAMAVDCDTTNRRIYRSISGKVPTRTIAMVWDPYRFQSRLVKKLMETIRHARPS